MSELFREDPQEAERRWRTTWLVVFTGFALLALVLVSGSMRAQQREEALEEVVASMEMPSGWELVSDVRTGHGLFGICLSQRPCPSAQLVYELTDMPPDRSDMVATLPDAAWSFSQEDTCVPGDIPVQCRAEAVIDGFAVAFDVVFEEGTANEIVGLTARFDVVPAP